MTRLGPLHEAQRSKRGASKQIGIADSAFSMKWCTGRLGALDDVALWAMEQHGQVDALALKASKLAASVYLEAEQKKRHTQKSSLKKSSILGDSSTVQTHVVPCPLRSRVARDAALRRKSGRILV